VNALWPFRFVLKGLRLTRRNKRVGLIGFWDMISFDEVGSVKDIDHSIEQLVNSPQFDLL